MQNRKKKDTDLQNSLLDSVGEGEGGMFQENSIEICIVSRVKQITSPGWMHETSTRIWCTGKTQGERVEREVGGGIGMGNTCKPMAVSFQCMTKFTTKKKKKRVNFKMLANFQIHVNVWQKPLQYCKVISLQLIKINGKNKIKYWPTFKKHFEDCIFLAFMFSIHLFLVLFMVQIFK